MRVLVLVLFSVLFFVCRAALACSCILPTQDPEEAVEDAADRADIVFLGKVERVHTADIPDVGAVIQESTFYILESWKGEKVTRVSTKINVQCCVCGFHFEEGETYLVFAYEGKDGYYSTSICSLTRRADQAEEYLTILRDIKAKE